MWFLGLDPVTSMTWHRGPSHSLLVLLPFAALLWWAFRRAGGRVAEAPVPWFWAIALALVTHPLLDAFTVYGTQLWWPLPPSPAMWSSVFISCSRTEKADRVFCAVLSPGFRCYRLLRTKSSR